jgi:hypothetical protein
VIPNSYELQQAEPSNSKGHYLHTNLNQLFSAARRHSMTQRYRTDKDKGVAELVERSTEHPQRNRLNIVAEFHCSIFQAHNVVTTVLSTLCISGLKLQGFPLAIRKQ